MFGWLFDKSEEIDTATKILTDYEGYLSYQSIFGLIGNVFVWFLIKLFYSLNVWLEKFLLQAFTLKDITTAIGISQFYSDLISKVAGILCVITLMYVAMKFAFSKNPPKFKNVLINTIMAVVLIIGGGSMIDEGLNLSQKIFEDTSGISTESTSFQLIKENTFDIEKVLATKSSEVSQIPPSERNNLTKKNFKVTDINAVLTPKTAADIADKYKKDNDPLYDRFISLKYVLDVNNEGKEEAIAISDGYLQKLAYESGYRRYVASTGVILPGEMSLTFAYIFIMFTIVITMFELFYKKAWLIFVSATDVETGERMKTAITDVTNGLLIIAFTGIELRIYRLLMNGLADVAAKQQMNPILYTVCLVSLTLALFKGSQAVVKYFGVDTGLKSGSQGLMGAYAAMQLSKPIANGLKSAASHGKNAASSLNSIRKNTPDKLQGASKAASNFASSTAEKAGYMAERGPMGAMKDSVNAAKEAYDNSKLADFMDKATDPKGTIKDMANQVTEPIKDSFEDGAIKASVVKTKEANPKKPEESKEPKEPGTKFNHNPTADNVSNMAEDTQNSLDDKLNSMAELPSDAPKENTNIPNQQGDPKTVKEMADNKQQLDKENKGSETGQDKLTSQVDGKSLMDGKNKVTGESAGEAKKVNELPKSDSSNQVKDQTTANQTPNSSETTVNGTVAGESNDTSQMTTNGNETAVGSAGAVNVSSGGDAGSSRTVSEINDTNQTTQTTGSVNETASNNSGTQQTTIKNSENVSAVNVSDAVTSSKSQSGVVTNGSSSTKKVADNTKQEKTFDYGVKVNEPSKKTAKKNDEMKNRIMKGTEF